MVDGDLGSVESVSRFPVKSMRGERIATARLTPAGFVGDRTYALIETASGKVVSAKRPRIGSKLLSCRAEFVEPFLAGSAAPPVRISLPTGLTVTSDDPHVDAVLSDYLGLLVSLRQTTAGEFLTVERSSPFSGQGVGAAQFSKPESVVNSSSSADAANLSPIPPGSFLDAFPVSVLTTSTLSKLGSLSPGSRFDRRRFRMNLMVHSPGEGFVEQEWLDREIRIGEEVQITVVVPDPRCVMTTLAQEDLPRDNGVLQTLDRHSRFRVGGGIYPCAGVYAVVKVQGEIREGDRLSEI